MSYILDALKKSEQERNKHQQRTGPRYPHPSGRSLPPRNNRIVPALIITSFLMLTIAIMGGGAWLALRDGPDEQRAAPSATSQPAVTAAPEPAAAGGPEPLAAADPEHAVSRQAQAHISTRARAPEDQDAKKGETADSDERRSPPPGAGADAQASVKSVPSPAPERPGAGDQPDTVKELPLISELEFSTRSMLPDMKFRGHAYSSTPAKRMIMINSMIVREGDTVAPDLRLKEITENGLIMSFRGIDFRVDLFPSQSR